MKHVLFFCISFSIFFSIAPIAFASTITVNPGQSLGNIINSASNGDYIKVNPGTYVLGEKIISQSNLTIEAQGIVKIKGAFVVEGSNNIVRGFEIYDQESGTTAMASIKVGIRVSGNDNLIEGNEIHNMLEDGMWIWGKRNTIRGNYMHHMLHNPQYPEEDKDHEDCFMIWTDTWIPYEIDGILLDGNICILNRTWGSNQFHITTRRDVTKTIKNMTWSNNVFISHDSGYSPIAYFGDSTIVGVKIVNNTFYNVSGQGAASVYLTNMPEVYIANNAVIGYARLVDSFNGSVVKQENNIINPTSLGEYQNYHITRASNKKFTITNFEPTTTGSNLTSIGGVTVTPTPKNPADLVDTGDTATDQVNLFDYDNFVINFGKTGAVGFIPADIIQDGIVNLFDYNKFVAEFGK